ncbi:galactose-binding domain-like protein [Talaromyces proteolyticus]|uniref:Galactose-binding domain-like protein n=1 Tax=Talaromyces proteolyticus TaxID=1131652 RepID=A0AAD4KXM9_9EURO|nr:galactose-binding domain-like protein [Talaromyces proteolyticus]KAH8699052.1 galactose-binding domain-like protein [Talaromyces proteolyticus]
MSRQPHRRPQIDPSTPVTGVSQQHQQPPPLRATAATTVPPNLETPPGFQFPPDALHPRRGVETLVGALPTWQPQERERLQRQQQRLAALAAASADRVRGTSELGETTEGEDEDESEDGFEHAFDGAMQTEDIEGDDEELEEGDEEDGEEDEDEEMRNRNRSASPLPPDLREISSLASWTVSTHKPGCGVAALRNPSPQQFWQSDGPQPHTLTLHFFKRVAIVKLRVYLDFELDESYTPTKMIFLAGMGGNDLVEFASWDGESPCGWVDIPLEGVGGRNRKNTYSSYQSGSRPRRSQRARPSRGIGLADDMIFEEETGGEDIDDNGLNEDPDDPYDGNVLKAMVIQVRICENHQNGKDTHVRGFQVFAHDDDRRRIATAAAAAGQQPGHKRQSLHKVRPNPEGEVDITGALGRVQGLDEPDWMGEPVIR